MNEVDEHLLDSSHIQCHFRKAFIQINLEGETSAFNLLLQSFGTVLQYICDIDVLQAERCAARFQASEIEEILNQCVEPIDFTHDSTEELHGNIWFIHGTGFQRFHQCANRSERGSQFVGNIGHKLAANCFQSAHFGDIA